MRALGYMTKGTATGVDLFLLSTGSDDYDDCVAFTIKSFMECLSIRRSVNRSVRQSINQSISRTFDDSIKSNQSLGNRTPLLSQWSSSIRSIDLEAKSRDKRNHRQHPRPPPPTKTPFKTIKFIKIAQKPTFFKYFSPLQRV